MRYLNDNVYQNIDKKVMGVKKYHNTDHASSNQKNKIKKDPLVFEEKEEIVDEFMQDKFGEQNKQLNKSLDKILATHRNSKIFLFMLTGPFFAIFTAVKYTIKLMVLMYIYKGKKKLD